jgi:hypothetical protein
MHKYNEFITEGRQPKYENILKLILSDNWDINSTWISAASNLCIFFKTNKKNYKFSLIISITNGILDDDTYNTLYLDNSINYHFDYELQPEDSVEVVKKLKKEIIRNIIEDPTKYKSLKDIPEDILKDVPDDVKDINDWGLI